MLTLPALRRPRRTVRLLLLTVSGFGAAAPATADVARLELLPVRDAQTHLRIHITASDGAKRTVGPLVVPPLSTVQPKTLFAAPDGRHAVILPFDYGSTTVPVVVPLDGRPPLPLVWPENLRLVNKASTPSWSADGNELVFGNVVEGNPTELERWLAVPRGADRRWTAVRCAVTTAICTELPGPGGSAVAVPSGALVTSSAISVLPVAYFAESINPVPYPAWEPRTSERGRQLRSIAHDQRVTSTHLEGAGSRTLRRTTASGSIGLPLADVAVGGPSGALVVQRTLRVKLRMRKGKVQLDSRPSGRRLLRVTPDGRARGGPLPRLSVRKRDVRRPLLGPIAGSRLSLRFMPQLGRPEGGWLGTGTVRHGLGDVLGLKHLALATMGPTGPARIVRVGGRAATVERLVRYVPRAGPVDFVDDLDVVGYEQSTRSAVVSIGWARVSKKQIPRYRTAVLRVPLDGPQKPTVVPGRVDTAW